MSSRAALMLMCVFLPACCVTIACSPKSSPMKPAGSDDNAVQIPTDVPSRVTAIRPGIQELTLLTAQLPGYGDTPRAAEATNRQLMRQCFETLARTLPILEGPNPTGKFRENLRVVKSSAHQLENASADISPEPAIAQGARAVTGLLQSVNAAAFESEPALKQKIDAMRKTVDGLDEAHEVRGRIVSARAMRQAADILRQMSSELTDRLAPATTRPATTQPSLLPAGLLSHPTEPTHPAPTTQPSGFPSN